MMFRPKVANGQLNPGSCGVAAMSPRLQLIDLINL
jgi:hypothetical protein